MVPKIKDIKVKDDYKLIVLFDNNQAKEYDAKMLIERHKSFHVLKDKMIFSMVKVDAGGYGISWNDDIDLSEYELWKNGRDVENVMN
ncbi:DUF2442 domain-containing protein [Desulfitibacter alkalitolerans]|uniref:DUF2442 domain-containing protein n=1 Tax=Desulfitibacter alkalitolerans TaxID=264641 RepID=UPI000481817A|nr:DUF2442 domain-containing protein [Desulfitibacter alkalitolerans]